MECYYHKNKEATFRCVECGKPICNECSNSLNGKHMCSECYSYEIQKMKHSKVNLDKEHSSDTCSEVHRINRFFVFILSLLPGTAQMYLGLMNRGVQLLGCFILSMILSIDLEVFIFIAATIIIWFYSFFDAHHKKNKLLNGIEVEDDILFNIDIEKIKDLDYKKVGKILLALGGYILISNILNYLQYSIGMVLAYRYIRLMEKSLIPIGLIILGVIFLKRAKVTQE